MQQVVRDTQAMMDRPEDERCKADVLAIEQAVQQGMRTIIKESRGYYTLAPLAPDPERERQNGPDMLCTHDQSNDQFFLFVFTTPDMALRHLVEAKKLNPAMPMLRVRKLSMSSLHQVYKKRNCGLWFNAPAVSHPSQVGGGKLTRKVLALHDTPGFYT